MPNDRGPKAEAIETTSRVGARSSAVSSGAVVLIVFMMKSFILVRGGLEQRILPG